MTRRPDPAVPGGPVFTRHAAAAPGDLTDAARQYRAWVRLRDQQHRERQARRLARDGQMRTRAITAGLVIGLAGVIALGFLAWEAMAQLRSVSEGRDFSGAGVIIRALIGAFGLGGGFTLSLRRPKRDECHRH